MSSWKGVFQLVFEDVAWYFGKLLLLFITIPVTIVWIILGNLWVDLKFGLALFGLTTLVNIILYRVGFTRS